MQLNVYFKVNCNFCIDVLLYIYLLAFQGPQKFSHNNSSHIIWEDKSCKTENKKIEIQIFNRLLKLIKYSLEREREREGLNLSVQLILFL